jgi:hypothetical protein
MESNILSNTEKKSDYIGVESNGNVKWLISTKCNGFVPLKEWTPYGFLKNKLWKLYLVSIPLQRALANLGIKKGYRLTIGYEPSIEGMTISCVYVNLITLRPKLVIFLEDGFGNYLVEKLPLNDSARYSLENEKLLMASIFSAEIVKTNNNSKNFIYRYVKGTPFKFTDNQEYIGYLASLQDGQLRSLKSFKQSLLVRLTEVDINNEYSSEISELKSQWELEGDILVPGAVTHGDFAPWNIKVRNGTLVPIDWEESILDGIVAWDLLTFEMSVRLHIKINLDISFVQDSKVSIYSYLKLVKLDYLSFRTICKAFVEVKVLEAKISNDVQTETYLRKQKLD